MKSIKKITAVYTIVMAAIVFIVAYIFSKVTLTIGDVGDFDSEELNVYKRAWEDLGGSFNQSMGDISFKVIVILCVIWALGYIFIAVMYVLHVKPIDEMEEYALEIAKGNLDVKLPIHKNNAKSSFVESFDIMREEIKTAKMREMEAERAKREMVGELSHDLKTPVATINATVEVIDAKYSMEKEKINNKILDLNESDEEYTILKSRLDEIDAYLEKVDIIKTKAELINQLVGNMLNATLDDLEGVKIKPEMTDSRAIERYFTNLKEYGNICLDNHIPECLVYIDPLRMEQVIDNVVGNSYKYAGTDIHVAFAETDNTVDADGKSVKYIKVTIRDSGPGVDKEDLPLIVQKYNRGANAKDKQGYGLGMYLVKHYMDKQGGGMEYYNDNGFVVELLVKKV